MIFHRILQKKKLQSIYFLSSVPLYSRSSGILQTELEFSTIAVYSGIPRFFNIKKSIRLSPFFFFFFPISEIIVHLDEPDHFACTKPYKASKRLFSLFFLRDFIGKSVSDLDEWKLFRLAYIYVATFPMIVNPISSWFIGFTSEWTWKLTCVLLIDLSHIYFTWKLS